MRTIPGCPLITCMVTRGAKFPFPFNFQLIFHAWGDGLLGFSSSSRSLWASPPYGSCWSSSAANLSGSFDSALDLAPFFPPQFFLFFLFLMEPEGGREPSSFLKHVMLFNDVLIAGD